MKFKVSLSYTGKQAGTYTGTGLEGRSPSSACWPLSRDHLPRLKTGVTVTVSQGTSVLVSKPPHLFREAARNGAVATEAATPLVCLGTAIGALSGGGICTTIIAMVRPWLEPLLSLGYPVTPAAHPPLQLAL